ncbi:MAG: hypothetical protein AAGA55_03340, partial [Planctomycetota bacterium]
TAHREEPDMKTPIAIRMLAVLGLAAGISQAQVAPPPPAEKPEQPEYNPEPQRPAQRPAARPQPNNNGNVTANRFSELPTDIPYPKLAQQTEEGRILRLKELPDILALRANPTIGDQSVDAIMPVVYGRRARFEMLVIENIDLYWELTAGAIANLDMSDLQEMSRVTEMVKPLVGKTTLSDELINRNILTRTQGGLNEYIVQEYKRAISDEIQALEGQDGLTNFMVFILEDSIHEARLAYQGLLVEARSKAREVLDRIGIDNKAIADLTGLIDDDPEIVEQQVAEFDAAIRTLGVEDAIRFFTAVREGRENPNISPTVTRIDVMHDRKTVYKGGMQARPLRGDEPILQGTKKKQSDEQPTED